MIICMVIATVLFIAFTYLILSASGDVAGALVNCCRETQREEIKKQQMQMRLLAEEMQKHKGADNKRKIKQGRACRKKLEEAEKQLERLELGKLNALDLIPLAGYRLMQLMKWDAANHAVKKLYRQCVQFKEKKEAVNYTYYLLGSLIGNGMLGVLAFFAGLGLALAMGLGARSLVVAVAAFAMFALMGYLPYDSVNVMVTKRKEDIARQFPQAVSKMALLIVAGMEVNQAWKLAAGSGMGTLYEEMSRVLVDFDNNVSPIDAYSKFITRCNNPYTTKLATAIIQNLSKGNAEIVKLFRTLNDESWMEYKHNARRMGEKIQSKLMLPTMLMFGGIIVLIIVPVMSGFNF